MMVFMLYNYNPDGEVHWYSELESISSILLTDFTLGFYITTRFATNGNKMKIFPIIFSQVSRRSRNSVIWDNISTQALLHHKIIRK